MKHPNQKIRDAIGLTTIVAGLTVGGLSAYEILRHESSENRVTQSSQSSDIPYGPMTGALAGTLLASVGACFMLPKAESVYKRPLILPEFPLDNETICQEEYFKENPLHSPSTLLSTNGGKVGESGVKMPHFLYPREGD